ncbi:hypothetical protein LINPERHAP1_LOCUS8084, partial [Linum perenne]
HRLSENTGQPLNLTSLQFDHQTSGNYQPAPPSPIRPSSPASFSCRRLPTSWRPLPRPSPLISHPSGASDRLNRTPNLQAPFLAGNKTAATHPRLPRRRRLISLSITETARRHSFLLPSLLDFRACSLTPTA